MSIGYPAIAENAEGDLIVVLYYHKVQQNRDEPETTQFNMVKVTP